MINHDVMDKELAEWLDRECGLTEHIQPGCRPRTVRYPCQVHLPAHHPASCQRRYEKVHRIAQLFAHTVRETLEEGIVSTIFLLGDGFKEGWAKESLKLLCRGRRVFQGNNLYSKMPTLDFSLSAPKYTCFFHSALGFSRSIIA